jgi:hypothetical protein
MHTQRDWRALRALSWSTSLALATVPSLGAAQDSDGSEPEQTQASDESASIDWSNVRDRIRLAKAPVGRLAATYDGGVMVLDGRTLRVVADIPLEGFLRLGAAGDDRHIVVSTDDAFRFLDTGVQPGVWQWPSAPRLHDYQIQSNDPGHVTVNAGKTVLFSDGSGVAQIFSSQAFGDVLPSYEEWVAPAPHHGVVVALDGPDGVLLVTVGTEEARNGAAVLNAQHEVIASSDQCPGVHGESVAADGVAALGCEDGVLVYRDGEFHKLQSPDVYGRIGNHAGDEHSKYILGDYKTDREAELERPLRVSIVDTQALTLKIVDLPASYTFRSLGRGPDGEGIVLGTDGALHVIDPEAAAVVDSFPVISAWEESLEWQEPRPTLRVIDNYAYVTEPSQSALHVVNLRDGSIVRSAELPHVPNELSGVTH